MNVDDPLLTAYGTDGSVANLDSRQGVPDRVLLILHPAEPKWYRSDRRPPSNGEVIEEPGESHLLEESCDQEFAIDQCGSSVAEPWAGPVVNRYRALIADGYGSPEPKFMHYQVDPFTGDRTKVWTHEYGHSAVGTWYFPNTPTTMATYVDVWEMDSWFTFGDDYWGRANFAASGAVTAVYGTCGQVFKDGDWYAECRRYGVSYDPLPTDPIHTTDIVYNY